MVSKLKKESFSTFLYQVPETNEDTIIGRDRVTQEPRETPAGRDRHNPTPGHNKKVCLYPGHVPKGAYQPVPGAMQQSPDRNSSRHGQRQDWRKATYHIHLRFTEESQLETRLCHRSKCFQGIRLPSKQVQGPERRQNSCMLHCIDLKSV